MSRIFTGVGSPGTVSAASGGRVYAFNNISDISQIVLGINPERQRIVVHNPGTVDIFFGPLVVIVNGSDVGLNASPTALGGMFRVYANGGTIEITGECQKQWQSFCVEGGGSTNPLTIMDSNV